MLVPVAAVGLDGEEVRVDEGAHAEAQFLELGGEGETGAGGVRGVLLHSSPRRLRSASFHGVRAW